MKKQRVENAGGGWIGVSVVVVGEDVVDGFCGGENDDEAFEVHVMSFRVEG